MRDRVFLKRCVLAVLVAVVVNSPLTLTHTHHDVVLLSLIAVAGTFACGLVVDGISLGTTSRWSSSRPATTALPSDREDARLTTYRRLLESHRSAKVVDNHLQNQIARLADQRLMHTYGFRAAEDPGRARTVLGPELSALMDHAAPARLSYAQVSRLIARIEEM